MDSWLFGSIVKLNLHAYVTVLKPIKHACYMLDNCLCRYGDSEPVIECDRDAEKSYLSLDELGHVLTHLSGSLQCKSFKSVIAVTNLGYVH